METDGADLRLRRAGVAVLVYLALVSPYLISRFTAHGHQWFVDLVVYREAGSVVLHHPGRLYDFTTAMGLPFTYPPFPAVLSAPLALVPSLLDAVVWTVVVCVLIGWLTSVAFTPVLARTTPRGRALALAALAAAVTWLLPVRDVIKFGQVDVFMVALVVADCLPRPAKRRRLPQGVLVGLATAVKLTPGLFIVYLWLTGRRRAAAVAIATFVLAQGLAAAVLPDASRQYWTSALFDSNRLGNNAGTQNQSWRAILLRLHTDRHVTTALWLFGVAVVVVVGLRRALAASRAGDELAGVALVGLLTVVVSPVSWIHHLAWLILVFGVLADDLRDRKRLWWTVALGVVFVLRLPWYGASLAFGHSVVFPARVLQDGFGLVVIALVFCLPWRRRGAHRGIDPRVVAPGDGVQGRPGERRFGEERERIA